MPFPYLRLRDPTILFWRGLAAAMTSVRRYIQPIAGQVIFHVLISDSGGCGVVYIDIVIMSEIHMVFAQWITSCMPYARAHVDVP